MHRLKVAGLLCVTVFSACARPVAEPVPPRSSQDAFLDDLERRTFDWFWEVTNPANGLVPDRWPSRPFASIAGS